MKQKTRLMAMLWPLLRLYSLISQLTPATRLLPDRSSTAVHVLAVLELWPRGHAAVLRSDTRSGQHANGTMIRPRYGAFWGRGKAVANDPMEANRPTNGTHGKVLPIPCLSPPSLIPHPCPIPVIPYYISVKRPKDGILSESCRETIGKKALLERLEIGHGSVRNDNRISLLGASPFTNHHTKTSLRGSHLKPQLTPCANRPSLTLPSGPIRMYPAYTSVKMLKSGTLANEWRLYSGRRAHMAWPSLGWSNVGTRLGSASELSAHSMHTHIALHVAAPHGGQSETTSSVHGVQKERRRASKEIPAIGVGLKPRRQHKTVRNWFKNGKSTIRRSLDCASTFSRSVPEGLSKPSRTSLEALSKDCRTSLEQQSNNCRRKIEESCVCTHAMVPARSGLGLALGLMVILFMTAVKEGNAQQRFSVSGKVIASASGTAIEGATITNKRTRIHSVTNRLGEYRISARPEDVLVYSFVGYVTTEEEINGREQIIVALDSAESMLEEVEINAGYYATSDRYRTGNIARVAAADIEKQPVSNPLLALQGRMPGVVITQQSGVPGNAVKIQIRGQNSLRTEGNAPLYIIDGVPVDAGPIFDASAGALLPYGLDVLNTINPQNIASIEVLKDADATAIYGSRGANGVVLITTKQGSGEETKVDLAIASGIGGVPKKLDLLSTPQYLEMRNEAFANDGTTPNETNAPDLVLWDTNRQTDWQETLLGQCAHYNDAQLSIAGGMAATAFRINAGWRKESMVFPGDMGQQLSSVGFNANHKAFSDKLSLNLAVNYGLAKNNTANHNFVLQALTLPPNAPPLFREDGSLNWENSTWDNPLSKLNSNNSISSENLNANTTISYAVYDGLQLKVNLGYANTHTALERREPITAWDPIWGDALTGSGMWGRDRRANWIVEPQVTYSKVFAYHRLDALVGGTFQNSSSQTFRLNSYGYINDALIGNAEAAANIRVTQDDHIDYRYTAAFARLGYRLLDRYIINLTGRRDGSTRFGPDKRFADFGAIGTAWIVSNEAFLKNVKYLNLLKVRGSYGATGNDRIGDYRYLDVYNVGNYYGITALQPAQLYNPDFSWEVNRKLDVEISAHLFADRLIVNAGWFRNVSSNQLVGYALPATTGFTNILANLPATVENKGWEFQLSLSGKNQGQFSWQTTANISIPKNTLLSYPGIEASSYGDTYVIGKSLSVRRLYQFEGVDVETGRYQLRDVNGDGRLDINDRITIVDMGRDVYGGLQQRLGFARFQLSFMLEFVKQNGRGGVLGATGAGVPGRNVNQPVYVMDRWREPGDEAHVQRFTASSVLNAFYNNAITSDYNIMDASFLRMRTATITYLWDSPLLEEIALRQCEFSVTAQNLFTITGYDGWDAERPGSSYLPALQVYTFGVRLKF